MINILTGQDSRGMFMHTLLWDPPQKLPRGFLSLGHADVPLSMRGIVHSTRTHSTRMSHIRNYARPTSHFLRMSHSCHSTRPTSHFLRISHSRHSTRPTSHFLQMSHSRHSIRPAFHFLRIFHIRLLLSNRTIQLPRTDMFGSFDNAYPDNICGQRFRCPA